MWSLRLRPSGVHGVGEAGHGRDRTFFRPSVGFQSGGNATPPDRARAVKLLDCLSLLAALESLVGRVRLPRPHVNGLNVIASPVLVSDPQQRGALSVGRRRESQDSAEYGYCTPPTRR